MIKVIITDDHQMVIDGIKLMLSTETDMTCVAEAHNGEELLELLPHTTADILLLDIDMPVLNGIQTCKVLQQQYPQLKVLAISMMREASPIKSMLQYGAKGFILKNAGQDELVEAIRQIHGGKTYFSTEVSEIVLFSHSSQHAKSTKKAHQFPRLSPREKDVLRLIVKEYTTAEIAEALFISFGTVETHRRNILMKLGARNTAGLVRIALEYHLLED